MTEDMVVKNLKEEALANLGKEALIQEVQENLLCTKQLALNVVMRARYPLNQAETDLSFVITALKTAEIRTPEEQMNKTIKIEDI